MHVVVEATDYQPDAIREKNYRSLSFAGSAATTDARSCIVVDVVAIRNSFGFVDRRHPVSGASKVPRVGTAGGATSPCGTLFFVERSLTCLR
jgi:hypothetical protein